MNPAGLRAYGGIQQSKHGKQSALPANQRFDPLGQPQQGIANFQYSLDAEMHVMRMGVCTASIG